MNTRILLLSLTFALPLTAGCEQKAKPEAEEEEVYEEEGSEEAPRHIDTNRKGFQAAGRAKEVIEGKGADRASAADDALNAGK